MTAQHGVLGIWRATSLVVGNIVGTGIFMLPASLAAYGTLGLLGWVFTSIGSVCLALSFARLAAKYPKTGGPYAYCREAFGDFVGFQMAWSYWIGNWAGNAAVATAFVSYLALFFPTLAEEPSLAFLAGLAAIWFFTLLNTFSVRLSGTVQMAIVVLKVLPLACIGIFGLFYIRLENFLPINPTDQEPLSVIAAASALTLFAFLGLESATIPADQVHNPKKTIPKATVLGTLISAIIYIWTTVVLLGVVPAATLAVSNAPFATAAGAMFGDWSIPVMAGFALLAAFGTLNGWILVQGQMPLAAAQDGLFPAVFGKISRYGTPWFSLIASSVLMSGVLYLNYSRSLVDQFTSVVLLTTFAVLVPYLYTAMADLYFVLQDTKLSLLQLWRAVATALVGFAYAILIVFGSGQESVFLGIICLFLGFPCYAFVQRTKNR